MLSDILESPPVAFVLFMALAFGIYKLGGAIAAKGEEHQGKRLPYASGEDLLLPEAQLTYHSFLRLALLFGVLHLAALVLSTAPAGGRVERLAFGYLIGIAISVFVLAGGDL